MTSYQSEDHSNNSANFDQPGRQGSAPSAQSQTPAARMPWEYQVWQGQGPGQNQAVQPQYAQPQSGPQYDQYTQPQGGYAHPYGNAQSNRQGFSRPQQPQLNAGQPQYARQPGPYGQPPAAQQSGQYGQPPAACSQPYGNTHGQGPGFNSPQQQPQFNQGQPQGGWQQPPRQPQMPYSQGQQGAAQYQSQFAQGPDSLSRNTQGQYPQGQYQPQWARNAPDRAASNGQGYGQGNFGQQPPQQMPPQARPYQQPQPQLQTAVPAWGHSQAPAAAGPAVIATQAHADALAGQNGGYGYAQGAVEDQAWAGEEEAAESGTVLSRDEVKRILQPLTTTTQQRIEILRNSQVQVPHVKSYLQGPCVLNDDERRALHELLFAQVLTEIAVRDLASSSGSSAIADTQAEAIAADATKPESVAVEAAADETAYASGDSIVSKEADVSGAADTAVQSCADRIAQPVSVAMEEASEADNAADVQVVHPDALVTDEACSKSDAAAGGEATAPSTVADYTQPDSSLVDAASCDAGAASGESDAVIVADTAAESDAVEPSAVSDSAQPESSLVEAAAGDAGAASGESDAVIVADTAAACEAVAPSTVADYTQPDSILVEAASCEAGAASGESDAVSVADDAAEGEAAAPSAVADSTQPDSSLVEAAAVEGGDSSGNACSMSTADTAVACEAAAPSAVAYSTNPDSSLVEAASCEAGAASGESDAVSVADTAAEGDAVEPSAVADSVLPDSGLVEAASCEADAASGESDAVSVADDAAEGEAAVPTAVADSALTDSGSLEAVAGGDDEVGRRVAETVACLAVAGQWSEYSYGAYCEHMRSKGLAPFSEAELIRAWVHAVFAPEGLLSRCIEGYSCSEQQYELAQKMAALAYERRGAVVLVQGAYTGSDDLELMLPVMLAGRNVMIASASVELQNMIVRQFLPFVLGRCGLNQWKTISLQTHSRYLCRHMIDTRYPKFVKGSLPSAFKMAPALLHLYHEIRRFAAEAGSRDGDLRDGGFGEYNCELNDRIADWSTSYITECRSCHCQYRAARSEAAASTVEQVRYALGEFEKQYGVGSREYESRWHQLMRVSGKVCDLSGCFVYAARDFAKQADAVGVSHYMFFDACRQASPPGHPDGELPLPDVLLIEEADIIIESIRKSLRQEIKSNHFGELARLVPKILTALKKARKAPQVEQLIADTTQYQRIENCFKTANHCVWLIRTFARVMGAGPWPLHAFKYQHRLWQSPYQLMGHELLSEYSLGILPPDSQFRLMVEKMRAASPELRLKVPGFTSYGQRNIWFENLSAHYQQTLAQHCQQLGVSLYEGRPEIARYDAMADVMCNEQGQALVDPIFRALMSDLYRNLREGMRILEHLERHITGLQGTHDIERLELATALSDALKAVRAVSDGLPEALTTIADIMNADFNVKGEAVWNAAATVTPRGSTAVLALTPFDISNELNGLFEAITSAGTSVVLKTDSLSSPEETHEALKDLGLAPDNIELVMLSDSMELRQRAMVYLSDCQGSAPDAADAATAYGAGAASEGAVPAAAQERAASGAGAWAGSEAGAVVAEGPGGGSQAYLSWEVLAGELGRLRELFESSAGGIEVVLNDPLHMKRCAAWFNELFKGSRSVIVQSEAPYAEIAQRLKDDSNAVLISDSSLRQLLHKAGVGTCWHDGHKWAPSLVLMAGLALPDLSDPYYDALYHHLNLRQSGLWEQQVALPFARRAVHCALNSLMRSGHEHTALIIADPAIHNGAMGQQISAALRQDWTVTGCFAEVRSFLAG
ncbi:MULTISPECIES: hypothetical protein [unclassified Anaerobiospirillum]|uniref:hypothetical protein n=1 Tax=unclassified Anaerobiospirillum TaxID=2647410 RepID=UPI001FF27200|nr:MULTISPECIES: hypothetical protein [unclassified Anaerobiospirillum]MCK0534572.1 hypothetical protein [Anaerobiospirillum sp. NML120511]MCK0540610.1 hypothetical protein [Anaerobiospirillum sp. NML02-A-032]